MVKRAGGALLLSVALDHQSAHPRRSPASASSCWTWTRWCSGSAASRLPRSEPASARFAGDCRSWCPRAGSPGFAGHHAQLVWRTVESGSAQRIGAPAVW